MTDVLDRPDAPSASPKAAKARLKVIDCDIHPSLNSRAEISIRSCPSAGRST